ncbi:heterokaryon incompatibility protein-domain-containing protein [Xylaria digitata]|nr:heterokaryon incompatibility protein-domain-containing protein [Xylaria digitata]
MRLINSKTFRLHEFDQSSPSIPRYAILSHTWEAGEEITFHDMSSFSSGSMRAPNLTKGFAKIMATCRLAWQDNLEYSINSMFRWYEKAAVCYVFLTDFIPGKVRLEACRWWTRGWTLQELLASDVFAFYDSTWEAIDTKNSLMKEISDITHIEQTVLSDKSQIFSCSVSQRMSWAASRKTTRIEDEAYCLLGIFGIHLPLLYGEGGMAFRRLQEEIIKRNADLTIFFWNNPRDGMDDPQYASLFAESPISSIATGAFRFVAKWTY